MPEDIIGLYYNPEFIDCYTVVYASGGGRTMNDRPTSPDGFCQYSDDITLDPVNGTRIGWCDLPPKVKEYLTCNI